MNVECIYIDIYMYLNSGYAISIVR